MRNLSNIFRSLAMATGVTIVTLAGFGTQKAQAQYYDDDYSNQGYNNQGYGNQGYDNGYDNGYGYDDGGYDYNYNSNDYTAFYNDLAPHGQWFRDPRYGMVWVPRVGAGFVPYQTNGYWAMTQYGNTWMSSYSWGWAAFHYGRWTFDQMYGWIWLPGRTWGPAWVSWRQGGGYYGWAPLGPGMSISMSFGYNPGFNCWTFVPAGNIYHTGGYNTYMRNVNIYNVYNRTTVINNYNRQGGRNYVLGPSRGDVEGSARRPVRVYNLSDRSTRGAASVRGNNISLYRPDVAQVSRSTRNVDVRNVRSIDVSSRNRNNGTDAVRNGRDQQLNNNRGTRSNESLRPGSNINRSGSREAVNPQRNIAPRQDNRQLNTAPDRVNPSRSVAPAAPSRTTSPARDMDRRQNMTPAVPQRNITPAPPARQMSPAPERRQQNMAPAPSRNMAPAPSRTMSPPPNSSRQNMEAPRREMAAPRSSAPAVQRSSAPAPRMENRGSAPARSNDGGGRPMGGGRR